MLFFKFLLRYIFLVLILREKLRYHTWTTFTIDKLFLLKNKSKIKYFIRLNIIIFFKRQRKINSAMSKACLTINKCQVLQQFFVQLFPFLLIRKAFNFN